MHEIFKQHKGWNCPQKPSEKSLEKLKQEVKLFSPELDKTNISQLSLLGFFLAKIVK